MTVRLDAKTYGGTALTVADVLGSGSYTGCALVYNRQITASAHPVSTSSLQGHALRFTLNAGVPQLQILHHTAAGLKSVVWSRPATGAWQFLHYRFDSGASTLELGINGIWTTASTGVGATDAGAETFEFGNLSDTFQLDALMLGYAVSKSALPDADVLAIRDEWTRVFDLANQPPVPHRAYFPDQIWDTLRQRSRAHIMDYASRNVAPIVAAAAPTFFDARGPERIPRLPAPASQQVSQGAPLAPERTSPLAAVDRPDRAPRPALRAELQQHAPWLPPLPETTKVPWTKGEHPDRVPRPLPRAADQQDRGALHPPPETTKVVWTKGEYPDAVPRPRTPAHAQPDAARLWPALELPVGFSAAYAQERVPRPAFPVPSQLDVTKAPAAPERTSALSAVEAPARVPRPGSPPWTPSFFAAAPSPERIAPLADVEWVDRPARPLFRAELQQDATKLPPAPERPLSLSGAEYPERARRPVLRADLQQDAPRFYPFPVVPLTAPTFFDARGPERVPRPSLGPERQQAALPLPPAPERTFLFFDAQAPERVPRPALAAAAQLDVTKIPAAPERTSALSAVKYPERVRRPFHGAPWQQDATTLPAAPEKTIAVSDVGFPGRVPRPAFGAERQQDATKISPFPEMRLPPAAVDYPARVPRPALHASLQLDATERPTQPEERGQNDWSALFQDRVPRPALRAELQKDVSQAPPAAFIATRLQAFTAYQDVVPRPAFGAALQRDHALWPSPISTPALTLLSTGWVVSPDRVPRAAAVPFQQPATTLSPRPEMPLPPSAVDYPARAPRPSLPAHAQQGSSALGPAPERTVWQASHHPDRVPRPAFPPAAQRDVALAFSPDAASPYSLALHPDRVPRPALHASGSQAARAALPERPEAPLPHHSAVYPERFPRRRPGLAPEPSSPPLHLARPDMPLLVESPARPRAAAAAAQETFWTAPFQPPVAPAPTFFLAAAPESVRGAARAGSLLLGVGDVLFLGGGVVVPARFFEGLVGPWVPIDARVAPLVQIDAGGVRSSEGTVGLKVGAVADIPTTIKKRTQKYDPGTLLLDVQSPSQRLVGAHTTYAYGVDPEIERRGVGLYNALVPCTEAGKWTYVWRIPDTPASGASDGHFDVEDVAI